jgi:hypothetical protein
MLLGCAVKGRWDRARREQAGDRARYPMAGCGSPREAHRGSTTSLNPSTEYRVSGLSAAR